MQQEPFHSTANFCVLFLRSAQKMCPIPPYKPAKIINFCSTNQMLWYLLVFSPFPYFSFDSTNNNYGRISYSLCMCTVCTDAHWDAQPASNRDNFSIQCGNYQNNQLFQCAYWETVATGSFEFLSSEQKLLLRSADCFGCRCHIFMHNFKLKHTYISD